MVYIRQRHDSNVYFRRTAPLGTFGIHYFSAARRMDTSTKTFGSAARRKLFMLVNSSKVGDDTFYLMYTSFWLNILVTQLEGGANT